MGIDRLFTEGPHERTVCEVQARRHNRSSWLIALQHRLQVPGLWALAYIVIALTGIRKHGSFHERHMLCSETGAAEHKKDNAARLCCLID